MAITFVGECWVEKQSEKGTQSHPNYVSLGSMSGGARVACHVPRNLVDFCKLVEFANHFLCLELKGKNWWSR